MRVDHAGELGAVHIYAGQKAVLGAAPRTKATAELIEHMAEQEARHKATFDRLLSERKVRPTALEPFWRPAGFALGAVTALMGEKAAHACTAAVEEVIDEHYRGQIDEIKSDEPELAATLEEFRAEEEEHRDTALHHGAEQTPGYGLLTGVIKFGCRAAIKIAEKI